jgi:hypothetical protein
MNLIGHPFSNTAIYENGEFQRRDVNSIGAGAKNFG